MRIMVSLLKRIASSRGLSVAATLAAMLIASPAQAAENSHPTPRDSQSRVVTIPPGPRIIGKPIFGSFNVWSLEDIRHVQALGVNLIHDYHREIQMQQLDVSSPMGRALHERGAQVLFDLQRHVKRGDRFVCDVETATKDVLAVRDSPNLWGYWVLDDMQGDQKQAAQDLYRLIKRLDPRHAVVAGFGGVDSLVNFDKDVCDLVAFYPYPIFNGRYHRRYIAHTLEIGLKIVHERSPDMPFIGVVQTFFQPMFEYGSSVKPTPRQVREQAEDYVRTGAAGLINYGWRVYEGKSASSYPDLAKELARVGAELASGKFGVRELPPPKPPSLSKVDQWQTECESATGFGSRERPAVGQQFVPSESRMARLTIMPYHGATGEDPVRVELCQADANGLPQESVPPIAQVTIPANIWREHPDRELSVSLSAELTPGRMYVIVFSCLSATPDFQRFLWSSLSGLGRPSYSKGHLLERSGSPLQWRDFWDCPRSLYFATQAR